jgi:hypothetical protein
VIPDPLRQVWMHLVSEAAKAHVIGCAPCRQLKPCAVGAEFAESLSVLLAQATETAQ